jgi:hypothetical protein
MQVERKQAIAAMKRFAGLPTAAGIDRKALVDQLVEAMCAHARSESHASRVAQSLLETCIFLPSVSNLINACEYTPDDETLVSTRKDCPYCMGDGWRTVDYAYGLSAAYPCDHTGHENPSFGIKLPASLQRQYSMEQVEAAGRRLAGFPLRRNRSGGSQGAEDELQRATPRL